MYTVKNFTDFPVPRRDATDQTLPGRESVTFFYSVGGSVWDGATIIMPGKTGGRSARSDFDLDCMLILALEPPEHSITGRPDV